jgi:hypothetical protein
MEVKVATDLPSLDMTTLPTMEQIKQGYPPRFGWQVLPFWGVRDVQSELAIDLSDRGLLGLGLPNGVLEALNRFITSLSEGDTPIVLGARTFERNELYDQFQLVLTEFLAHRGLDCYRWLRSLGQILQEKTDGMIELTSLEQVISSILEAFQQTALFLQAEVALHLDNMRTGGDGWQERRAALTQRAEQHLSAEPFWQALARIEGAPHHPKLKQVLQVQNLCTAHSVDWLDPQEGGSECRQWTLECQSELGRIGRLELTRRNLRSGAAVSIMLPDRDDPASKFGWRRHHRIRPDDTIQASLDRVAKDRRIEVVYPQWQLAQVLRALETAQEMLDRFLQASKGEPASRSLVLCSPDGRADRPGIEYPLNREIDIAELICALRERGKLAIQAPAQCICS